MNECDSPPLPELQLTMPQGRAYGRPEDAMARRDRDFQSAVPQEKLYVQTDANFNVTALVNLSGAVVERYVYTPYGVRGSADANWNGWLPQGFYMFRYGHQGSARLHHRGQRPAWGVATSSCNVLSASGPKLVTGAVP
jgi:hypothetical protein